jgi:hypothetical protein
VSGKDTASQVANFEFFVPESNWDWCDVWLSDAGLGFGYDFDNGNYRGD